MLNTDLKMSHMRLLSSIQLVPKNAAIAYFVWVASWQSCRSFGIDEMERNQYLLQYPREKKKQINNI